MKGTLGSQCETSGTTEDDGPPHFNILPLLDYSKHVLVIGDLLLDRYVHGNCTRIASECPMPVFTESSAEIRPGGAGNVAVNLRAMGLCVDIVSLVGYDDAPAINSLQENNINIHGLIKIENYKVEVKTRYISNLHQVFRADEGGSFEISTDTSQQIINTCTHLLSMQNYQAVLLSDYRRGILSERVSQEIISLAKTKNVPTVVDPARINGFDKYRGCTIIKPNLEDGRHFYQKDFKTNKDINAACRQICERHDINICVMTLSEKGIALYQRDKKSVFDITPANKPIELIDVIGAGDTVMAGIGFGICHRWSLAQTCRFANACAANTIKRQGTSPVNILDLVQGAVLYSKKELLTLRKLLPQKSTIVLTTGCFDIMHVGHVESLRKGKELGDYLVVALNSDSSIKKIKGPDRPICSLESRVGLLQAITYVDFIVVFDEDAPVWVVETLDPDVFVKGSEYTEERIKNRFPSVRNFRTTKHKFEHLSTTGIIKKISKL